MTDVRHLSGTIALVGIIAASAGPAQADAFGTPPLKQGAPVSIAGYRRENPRCEEWTNGCVLCVAQGGSAQCSTPGIACLPAGITCKRQAH